MADESKPFSIQDYVIGDVMELHIEYQRHAIDYLVAKGHITVHKTSVIGVNEHGLVYAIGDEHVPGEMPFREACPFQAGVVAASQYTNHLSLWNSLWRGKPWKSMNAEESYSTVISLQDSLPKTTHAAWAALADKLRHTTAPHRSKSTLREKIEKACEQEALDWEAFDDFKEACADEPMRIQWEQSRILLFKLMGVISMFPGELNGDALRHDADAAESISSLLLLLRVFKRRQGNGSHALHPLLREECQDLENLLKENKGAPAMRDFIELFIDRDSGNDRRRYDNDDQEELPLHY